MDFVKFWTERCLQNYGAMRATPLLLVPTLCLSVQAATITVPIMRTAPLKILLSSSIARSSFLRAQLRGLGASGRLRECYPLGQSTCRPRYFCEASAEADKTEDSRSQPEQEKFYDMLLEGDDAFVKQHCESKRYRGSGPGGQHRNKVETCARVTHIATGISATACEHRELKLNTDMAVRRLRIKLAADIRHPFVMVDGQHLNFPGTKGRISASNKGYPLFVARFLDVLAGNKGQLRPAAEAFGITSSAATRIAFADKVFLASVQSIRQQNGLNPLKSR